MMSKYITTYKTNWKTPAICALSPIPIVCNTHLLKAVEICLGREETIPAKMIMEIPFPIPLTEIWSPNHMTSMEPDIITKTISIYVSHSLSAVANVI